MTRDELFSVILSFALTLSVLNIADIEVCPAHKFVVIH